MRAPDAAAVLAAVSSRLLAPGGRAPMIPGGDEPHYLIITQSLLIDGDLRSTTCTGAATIAPTTAGAPPHVQMRGRNGPDLFGPRARSAGTGRSRHSQWADTAPSSCS